MAGGGTMNRKWLYRSDFPLGSDLVLPRATPRTCADFLQSSLVMLAAAMPVWYLQGIGDRD